MNVPNFAGCTNSEQDQSRESQPAPDLGCWTLDSLGSDILEIRELAMFGLRSGRLRIPSDHSSEDCTSYGSVVRAHWLVTGQLHGDYID